MAGRNGGAIPFAMTCDEINALNTVIPSECEGPHEANGDGREVLRFAQDDSACST
jgi:hypothetical protein